MTEHDPQPGELWETDWTDWNVAAEKRDGVWYRPGGKEYANQDQTPERLVGYTVEYVEALQLDCKDIAAQRNAALRERDVERKAKEGNIDALNVAIAERNAAAAEVESLRAERKPWDVLREAAKVVESFTEYWVPTYRELADELEAKAAEDSRREQRIEKAAQHLWAASDQHRELDDYRIDARALDEAGLLKDVDDE